MNKQKSKYVPQMNTALQALKNLPGEQRTVDKKNKTVTELSNLIEKTRKENLQERFTFSQNRFLTAVGWSLGIGLSVTIIMILISSAILVPDQYVLYHGFSEWESCGSNVCPAAPVVPLEDEVRNVVEAITQITQGFFSSASFISENDGKTVANVAGLARIGIVISVIISVLINYRKTLKDRYRLNNQSAQFDDYDSMSRFIRYSSRICFTIACAFGTYAIISVTWLAVSQIFKPEFGDTYVYLDFLSAAAIILLSIVIACSVASYLALAITTREILALGLSTFVIGLSVSATLADPLELLDGSTHQWWYSAVSNLGKGTASAPLFTATLFSVALVLFTLWFDIDSLIRQMLDPVPDESEDTELSVNTDKNHIRKWLSKKSVAAKMRVASILYFAVVIGFVLVGLVRTQAVTVTPLNWLLHTGGAFGAIACVVILSILVPVAQKDWFSPWYLNFSTYIVPLISGVALVMKILGWINLTILELILFGLIAVWLYLTMENLTVQANYRFQTRETDELSTNIEKILEGKFEYDESLLLAATGKPLGKPIISFDTMQPTSS